MNKRRDHFWNHDRLRLQAVMSGGEDLSPEQRSPRHPYVSENRDKEQDTVEALAWPRETGWRSH